MLSREFLLPQMKQFKSLRVFFMNVGVWLTDWLYVFDDADNVQNDVQIDVQMFNVQMFKTSYTQSFIASYHVGPIIFI